MYVKIISTLIATIIVAALLIVCCILYVLHSCRTSKIECSLSSFDGVITLLNFVVETIRNVINTGLVIVVISLLYRGVLAMEGWNGQATGSQSSGSTVHTRSLPDVIRQAREHELESQVLMAELVYLFRILGHPEDGQTIKPLDPKQVEWLMENSVDWCNAISESFDNLEELNRSKHDDVNDYSRRIKLSQMVECLAYYLTAPRDYCCYLLCCLCGVVISKNLLSSRHFHYLSGVRKISDCGAAPFGMDKRLNESVIPISACLVGELYNRALRRGLMNSGDMPGVVVVAGGFKMI